jgi:sec-independent protein translocase protein TatB
MDSILGIGGNELIIILVLAAIILGPERIARAARGIGRFVRSTKAYFSSLSSELKAELDILDEMEKVKKDLQK